MRRAYQTDLSDAEWARIEPHLTPQALGPGLAPIAFGKMDDPCSVALLPPPVVEPVITLEGSVAVSRQKPSYHPRLYYSDRCRHDRPAIPRPSAWRLG